MSLFRGIDFENLEDGEYIQFFGVHMLSWGDIERATGIKPTIAFIEDDTLEQQKAALVEALEIIQAIAKDPGHRTNKTQLQTCRLFDELILPIIEPVIALVGER